MDKVSNATIPGEPNDSTHAVTESLENRIKKSLRNKKDKLQDACHHIIALYGLNESLPADILKSARKLNTRTAAVPGRPEGDAHAAKARDKPAVSERVNPAHHRPEPAIQAAADTLTKQFDVAQRPSVTAPLAGNEKQALARIPEHPVITTDAVNHEAHEAKEPVTEKPAQAPSAGVPQGEYRQLTAEVKTAHSLQHAFNQPQQAATQTGQPRNAGSLTYRFRSWGEKHEVTITEQGKHVFTLKPSDVLVERHLQAALSDGNPVREWRLVERLEERYPDTGQQKQQEQSHDDEEEQC